MISSTRRQKWEVKQFYGIKDLRDFQGLQKFIKKLKNDDDLLDAYIKNYFSGGEYYKEFREYIGIRTYLYCHLMNETNFDAFECKDYYTCG